MMASFWASTDIALPSDKVTLRSSSEKTIVTVESQRFGLKTLEIEGKLLLCEETAKAAYLAALGFQDDASVSVIVTSVIQYNNDDDEDDRF
ncbi:MULTISPECIES: hypothetical protein [Trichocoleus]|uniref:Uncharacterized protein n=1 Tax=Trichocoleus desertorum GB2-A4 TaxID=2933944 RepID=A0ABV0JFI3_9CYAN|nr:hypothetical protein [Trichocoleus sp. FACHB-46]MBD1863034.1 hypothetical protein [Trichocoleus sp. FACHB-46]